MSHFAHGAGRLPPAYATRLAADDPRLKITAMLSYGPPATVRVESNWLKFSFLPPADTSADKRGYPLTEHIWPRLVTHNATRPLHYGGRRLRSCWWNCEGKLICTTDRYSCARVTVSFQS